MTANTDQRPGGCLATFLNIFRQAQPTSIEQTSDEPLPYRLRADFLSPAELSFYHVLASVVGDRAVISTKVRLADLFFVPKSQEQQAHRNRIDRKHLDFLLCEPKTMRPLVGLELDDKSHERQDRAERDAFVDAVFEAAGIPLLHIPTKQTYNPREIADQLKPLLESGSLVPDLSSQPVQTISAVDQQDLLPSLIKAKRTDIQQSDIQAIAAFCKAHLDLASAQLVDEDYYQSLPFCVIDTIYSINANYTSTRNTVIRFCDYFGLNQINRQKPGATIDQLSTSAFIDLYDQHGVVGMAEQVYQNRQRTSTRSGILKAEAVLLFSQVLQRFGIEYLQNVEKIIGDPEFEKQVQSIPGQGSGISLRYFYMLAGSDDHIKPDRMIARFIQDAINKPLSIQQSHDAIVGACSLLAADFPTLTPRLLDNLIWRYQRSR